MNRPETIREDNRHPVAPPAPALEHGIFTLVVDGETFGLPVGCVHMVFRAAGITVVPLGPYEVIGLVNLRGMIVTAVSLRRRLGLEDRGPHVGVPAIGIEHEGETFALFVDEVGDVLMVSEDAHIAAPPNVTTARLELTAAVYRLEGRILPVLDLGAVLRFGTAAAGAA